MLLRPLVASIALAAVLPASAAPPAADAHFKIDQFGYRPSASKVAVVSEPVVG